MTAASTLLVGTENNPLVKRSLILAGGGMRLAYQAGVLKALEESSLLFNHVDGTSGGIFNTAMIASGLSPEEMTKRWRKVAVKNFMSYRPWKEYLNIAHVTAFGDADGIRTKIFPALGIDLKKINANEKITATFNVCNFSDKSIESITHHAVTEDHLIAGMSLPIFMPAIRINDAWYSDAVWIKDANLMEAVRRGAEELWLVWAIGNGSDYLRGSFNQYVHMIEMSANGGLLEEYAQITFLNQRILKGDSPYGQKKPIRLFVIKPEFPLPLDPDLMFDKVNTSTLINMGYADARKYLQTSPLQEIPFDSAASKMRQPGVTLNFRQRFSGAILFGSDKTIIVYSPSFNLRRWDDKLSIYHQSSIYISLWDTEISTANNITNVIKIDGVSCIKVSSEFEHDGQVLLINALIPLTSSLDWLMALEFKKVRIDIITKSTGEIKGKGILTQSIVQRFKGLFNSSLRNYFDGTWVFEKYRMISKLYSHEI